MSLNRYHNSRSSDNVFKLLHEENTYLDILKGNVRAVYKDEIGEDKAVAPHDGARQSLLQEQKALSEQDPGTEKVEDSEVDKEPPKEEGTPEQQEKAVEDKAAPEGAETDEEMGVKEDIDELLEKEIEEISIAVARQAGRRAAMGGAAARKGALMSKASTKRFVKKSRSGLRG